MNILFGEEDPCEPIVEEVSKFLHFLLEGQVDEARRCAETISICLEAAELDIDGDKMSEKIEEMLLHVGEGL